MTAPTPETLDWLRQCAAAPGARWHRALLAEVEGQAPSEIEPIPAEGLAWLHQSARVHGATYSQVLLHVLERVEALERPEVAQQQPADHVPGVTKMVPTPEAAPVATDEELLAMRSWSSHGPTFDSDLVEFGRSCYDLGRQHGAAAAQPAPPVAPAGGLVERVVKVIADPDGPAELWHDDDRAAIREVAAWLDERGMHGCPLWLREEAGR